MSHYDENHNPAITSRWADIGGPERGSGHSVVVVRFLERPCAARIPVYRLDIAQAPPDLGRRVGLPVSPGAGHLAARQGLRDPVRAARVLRVVGPPALPVPDIDQAAEISGWAEAEAAHHVVGNGLRGVRV